QSEKKHPPAAIAAQGLHGGVIDDFHGAPKSLSEVERHPAPAQVVRLADWTAMDHGARIADRDGVILPMRCGFADGFDHFFGGHFRSRRNFDTVSVAGREHFEMSAA